jgi:hypothetical protein
MHEFKLQFGPYFKLNDQDIYACQFLLIKAHQAIKEVMDYTSKQGLPSRDPH